jgi:hypothetical protein
MDTPYASHLAIHIRETLPATINSMPLSGNNSILAPDVSQTRPIRPF